MIDLPNRIYNIFSSPVTDTIRGKSGFYPSDASIIREDGEKVGSCLRQQYYRWNNCARTEESDPEIGLISVTGEALHSMMSSLIRNHPVETNLLLLREEQAFFDKDILLSGRIDMLLYDILSGEVVGCDVKTVGDYASSVSIDQPRLKDVLQCAIYLDQYQKNSPKGEKMDSWIILYLARAENWKLKKYPHGSQFKYLWQFSISFDPEDRHVIIENQFSVKTHYNDITPEKIYSRYKELKTYIKDGELPPRDYEHTYSEERLLGMYKNGKVKFKKDLTVIDKWINNGMIEGKLGLDMGDFECRYCSFKSLCWSDKPEEIVPEKKYLYKLSDKSDLIIPGEPKTTASIEPVDNDYI
jgi:hypothetical protein